MLKSEFCQLASLAVPQLLHALSLSHGADIFWNLINMNFNSKDWKIRFEAGERYICCLYLLLRMIIFRSQPHEQILTPHQTHQAVTKPFWIFYHLFLFYDCFVCKVIVAGHECTISRRTSVCLHNMPPKPPPAHSSHFGCHGYCVARTGGKEELWD